MFEKNSTRTRVSFDIAMRQLDGTVLMLEAGSSQLGRGESIADTARVLSRMVDAIMLRTDDNAKIEEMARHATGPVINGLTDRSHPYQIAAMEPYRVDKDLMSLAKPDAVFLHCLPAHIGDEVTEEVFEGSQSVVFDEAENQIHAQKSIPLWSFGLPSG